jgi:hypothetical protein
MRQEISPEELRRLRHATSLAACIAGTTSNEDRTALAKYILKEFRAGVSEVHELAYVAAGKFWNDQPSP